MRGDWRRRRKEGGRKEVEEWEGASKDRLARMNQKRKKNTKIEDS